MVIMKRKEFRSWFGWFNYHIFWTGFVLRRAVYTNNEGQEKVIPKTTQLRRIKTVYGHNIKSKVWTRVGMVLRSTVQATSPTEQSFLQEKIKRISKW